jgi:endonuclease-3 related protein
MLLQLYRQALEAHGHRHWWPARSKFEIMVGAILTQNSAWTNVEKALAALRARQSLQARAIARLAEDELAEIIRPSGYYRQKAKKLHTFVAWYLGRAGQSWHKYSTQELRRQLLDLWGIGQETADSMLLYAFDRETFVIDKYTFRIAQRHGWWGLDAESRYNDKMYRYLQEHFEGHLAQRSLSKRLDLYQDFHAQIVYIGNHYCRTKPSCAACPWPTPEGPAI